MYGKTIIIGDPHIGANTSQGKIGPGQLLNSRIIDRLDILDWVLLQAEIELVNDIVITGDLFEEHSPPPYLIALFFNWVTRCKMSNINVHIIMGNHDFIRIGGQYRSSLDVIIEADMDNVFIYKNMETIYIGNIAYTMMPYRDRKSVNSSSNEEAILKIKNIIAYELLSIPMNCTKIAIGHLAIEGSIPVGDEIDDTTNELFFKPSDFKQYDYVWMGHVHKPQVMNKHNPYVAHIGSMDISNFGETDQSKHIIVIDPDSKNIFKKITIPTRQLKKILITVPDNIKNSTEFVLEELKKEKKLSNAILKIEIVLDGTDLDSINKNIVEQELLKNGIHAISNISESKKTLSVTKKIENEIDNKVDVKSAISLFADKFIEENKRSGFKSLANSLYSEFLVK